MSAKVCKKYIFIMIKLKYLIRLSGYLGYGRIWWSNYFRQLCIGFVYFVAHYAFEYQQK